MLTFRENPREIGFFDMCAMFPTLLEIMAHTVLNFFWDAKRRPNIHHFTNQTLHKGTQHIIN